MSNVSDNGSPLFTRAEMRDLAREEHEERVAVMRSGGNVHQFHLDMQDKHEAHVSGWPADEQSRYFQLLAEETTAIAAGIEDRASRSLSDAQAEQDARMRRGAFVLLAALIFVLGTWLGYF